MSFQHSIEQMFVGCTFNEPCGTKFFRTNFSVFYDRFCNEFRTNDLQFSFASWEQTFSNSLIIQYKENQYSGERLEIGGRFQNTSKFVQLSRCLEIVESPPTRF